MQMNTLMTQVQGLRGAARANSGGSVEETAGQMDAETTCAVAVMCSPHLETAASLLQLGNLQGFALMSEKATLYVQRKGEDWVVATGEPNKSPDVQLKKIGQLAGGALK